MVTRLSTLPADLRRLTMEYCLHRHCLPYRWNQAFNACIRELPKRLRVKTLGKTFVRYERFPGEDLFSSRPYRKPRKRMVRTDYAVAFGNHRIRLEEVAYDVVL